MNTNFWCNESNTTYMYLAESYIVPVITHRILCGILSTPLFIYSHIYMQAYKQGLRYPKQQFIILGWYGDGWWMEPESERKLDCTPEEIAETLDYTLATQSPEFYTNTSLVTEGGLVSVLERACMNNIVYIILVLTDSLWIWGSVLEAYQQLTQCWSSREPDKLGTGHPIHLCPALPWGNTGTCLCSKQDYFRLRERQ